MTEAPNRRAVKRQLVKQLLRSGCFTEQEAHEISHGTVAIGNVKKLQHLLEVNARSRKEHKTFSPDQVRLIYRNACVGFRSDQIYREPFSNSARRNAGMRRDLPLGKPVAIVKEAGRGHPLANVINLDNDIAMYAVRKVFSEQNKSLGQVVQVPQDIKQSFSAEHEASLRPPSVVEFAAKLFLKPEHREHVLGDWSEDFARNAVRHGRSAALVIYCWDVARSAGPALWSLLKRLAAISILADLYRRWRGL